MRVTWALTRKWHPSRKHLQEKLFCISDFVPDTNSMYDFKYKHFDPYCWLALTDGSCSNMEAIIPSFIWSLWIYIYCSLVVCFLVIRPCCNSRILQQEENSNSTAFLVYNPMCTLWKALLPLNFSPWYPQSHGQWTTGEEENDNYLITVF